MAFVPSSGGGKFMEGPVGSAFKRGDLLCYNSASSLSLAPPTASGVDIAGIATADSTQSVNGKVTYFVPDFDTVFLADCNAGSAATKGALTGIAYSAATGHYVSSSGTVMRAVHERAVADVQGQSVQSRALVRLISNAGDLAHS